MHKSQPSQAGFTLIEIAIVLLVVTILLGYTVAMFSVQQELRQYRNAESQMDSAIRHLTAFAQVNGRLPCPDTGAGTIDGLEDALVDDCVAFFGFLPAKTLGMNGKFNDQGVLLDPWGSGYGYAVSAVDVGADGTFELVSANGIRNAGIAAVQPDLFICDDSNTPGDDIDCTTVTGNEVLGSNGEVAAVLVSMGKDSDIPASSNIQAENIDNFDDGTLDKVYIFSPQREDYDDVVKWISTNLLFSKMIEAEQLP
jgi:prepilin-type N-terminal cleavage/methylation domain-containing protein